MNIKNARKNIKEYVPKEITENPFQFLSISETLFPRLISNNRGKT